MRGLMVYRIEDKNVMEEVICDLTIAYDLTILNTQFKEQEEHLITFKSWSFTSQLNLLLLERKLIFAKNYQRI